MGKGLGLPDVSRPILNQSGNFKFQMSTTSFFKQKSYLNMKTNNPFHCEVYRGILICLAHMNVSCLASKSINPYNNSPQPEVKLQLSHREINPFNPFTLYK